MSFQEWTQDGAGEDRHASETMDAAATDEVQEDGFDLVVGMMGSQDVGGSRLFSRILQESVAFDATGFL